MATSVDLRLRGINVSTQRHLPRTKRRKDQNDQGLFDFIYVLGDDAREEAREVEKKQQLRGNSYVVERAPAQTDRRKGNPCNYFFGEVERSQRTLANPS